MLHSRLDGEEEVKLKHNFAAKAEIRPILTPYKFKGEWHTECLITGQRKVVDMYIIFDRQQVRTSVKALEAIEGVPIHHEIATKGTTLIYSYNGNFDVESNSSEGDTSKHTLKAGETFEVNTVDDKNILLQIEAHPGCVKGVLPCRRVHEPEP